MPKPWVSIQDLLRQKLGEDPRPVHVLCKAVGLGIGSYYRFTRGEGGLVSGMVDRLMKEYNIVAIERPARSRRRTKRR